MKNFILIFALAFVTMLQASTILDNGLKLGNGTTSGNKELVFDTGAGAANKRVRHNSSTSDLEVTTNKVKIGDGAATDKTLQFNDGVVNPTIKFDNASGEIQSSANLRAPIIKIGSGANGFRVNGGNLEFTNDNALFKKVGSGSGSGSGGVNIATNESFEDGVSTGWTSSGGTFSSETHSSGHEGDLKYSKLISTVIGDYFETSATVVPSNLGKGCMADISLLIASGTWTVSVIDGSANVLASVAGLTSAIHADWLKIQTLTFPCPAAAATMKLRIASTATGTISGDLAYLGGNKNLTQGSFDTEWEAFTPTGTFTTNTTYTGLKRRFKDRLQVQYKLAFSGAPNTIGLSLNLPTFKGVAVEIDSAKLIDSSSTNTLQATKLGDGTLADASGGGPWELTARYKNTTSFDVKSLRVTTSILDSSAIASQATPVVIASPDFMVVSIDVPIVGWSALDSNTGLSSDQSSWFIDANIGGGNPAMGVGNVTSYTEITNSTLDLVLNSGSSTAKIPCSSTNASTGLTCSSGNEGVGIVFTPPYSGYFDICADFTHKVTTASGAGLWASFQLVETTNSTQTIIQEGKDRKVSGNNIAAATTVHSPQKNCGSFYFSSVSEKTIRLMFEQAIAGSPSDSSLIADRAASLGQADIRITVKPSIMNIARPILTGDQVTTPSAAKPAIGSFFGSSVGVVSDHYGGIITGNPVLASSVYTYTFTPNFWASKPNCTVTDDGSTGLAVITSSSASTLVIAMFVFAGTPANRSHQVICHGLRQ